MEAVHEVAGPMPVEETEMKAREAEIVLKEEATKEVMVMTSQLALEIVPEEEVLEVINPNLIVHAVEINPVTVVEKVLVVVDGENNFNSDGSEQIAVCSFRFNST